MKREFYNAANKYAKHGWSIIPIGRDKKPALRTWKGFQSKRPTDKQLRQWFLDGQGVRGQVTGLAAVCGDVSGDLVVRDFDSMEAYQAWAKAYPKLAAKLPTVQTARGRHVYFRNGHSRIEVMNDGELRGKGYVLLPPSIHPTGVLYDWIVPLSNGPLPEVPDPAVAGLIAPKKSPSSRETQKTQKTQENTENSSGKEKRVTVKSPAPPGARDSGESLDSIIDRTIPRSKGCRHRGCSDSAVPSKQCPNMPTSPQRNSAQSYNDGTRQPCRSFPQSHLKKRSWISTMHGKALNMLRENHRWI